MLKNTLLWKIRPKGQPEAPISYVFGTMHVQDERVFGRWAELTDCIDACQAFAAEYDLSETQPREAETPKAPKAWEGLSKHLSPSIYAKLNQKCLKRLGMSAAAYEHSHPLLLVGALSAAGFETHKDKNLDASLFEYAQQQGKQLTGVETWAAQMGLFGRLPFKTALSTLKSVATQPARLQRQLRQSTKAYLEQDLKRLLVSVKKSTGDMRQVLLYDRNLIMTQRIAELATQQSVFVAIGAGHLAGGKGVLRGLKRLGFEVKGE